MATGVTDWLWDVADLVVLLEAAQSKKEPQLRRRMKTYWLSFCDERTGENIGICVVEVSEEDIDEAAEVIKTVNPDASPSDSEKWAIAAIGESIKMECNPGGEAQAIQVDPAQLPADIPRNRLIQQDELRRNGWA